MDTIIPKTQPWEIESPQASYAQGVWTLKCGGAQMPEYTIIQPDLEDAIFELVKAVTRDAIEDEARAWLNDTDEWYPDEWYPVHSVTDRTTCPAIEVTPETLQRWQRITGEFEAMQKEISEALETAVVELAPER